MKSQLARSLRKQTPMSKKAIPYVTLKNLIYTYEKKLEWKYFI